MLIFVGRSCLASSLSSHSETHFLLPMKVPEVSTLSNVAHQIDLVHIERVAEDTGVIGLVILCAIGYGIYAYFDKKPSQAEQTQQQQQTQEIQELKVKIAELEKKPEHHYELRTLGSRQNWGHRN